ncbi:MAG: polysaccharide biosynthesis C-terminal domain-containing protein, partial [Bacteroidota bacterium]
LRSLAIRLLTIIFLLLFVKQPGDVLPYLLISVLSIVSGHIWNLFYALGKIRFIFKALAFTKHLTPIFLIFLMNVCISMYTVFDTSWVGFLSTSSAVGMYTSAIKLAKIAIPLVTTLGLVLIPRSARAFAANISNPQHLNTSFNFIVDTSVPICVGLFLLSPELLRLFSGDAFMDALWAMRLLSFLPLLIGLSNLFGMQILSASGHDKALLFCVFIGMVLNIAINIWLVPLYAHNGAAIAMFVAEVSVTLATFIAVQAKFNLKFQFMRLLKSFGISLLFIPCIMFLHYMFANNSAIILSGILICGLIYIAMQHLLFRNEFILLGLNLFRQKLNK